MEPPLTARYHYEPPVEKYPSYFIEYFVSALVEELSPLFGYNLKGQQTYNERIFGANGKLGAAILQEQMQNPERRSWAPNAILGAREW